MPFAASTPSPGALALLFTCVPSAAQATLFDFDETEPMAGAGTAVALWEDLDGDGTVEWVVGAPYQDSGATDAGRVRVFSGADGAERFRIDGAVQGGGLGRALANVGDLDGDGKDDLAVGASGERRVRVYSGATQALLWERTEPGRERFGQAIAAAGDANADGQLDVVIGAPGHDSVLVVSGADGATIYSVRMTSLGEFGWSVTGMGDANGDGFDDLAVGAPYTFNAIYNEGAVAVLLGPTGAVDHLHRPNDTEERGLEFGYSVAPTGDIDDDGFDDYAVGARFYGGLHYVDDNYVAAFSGASHLELRRVVGGRDQWFGHSLAEVGDVDADGHPDLAIGNPLGPEIVLWSPRRDAVVHVFDAAGFEFAGQSVDGGRDVDGFGFLDLIQGTSVQWFSSLPAAGRAVVFTYGCPSEAVYPYCVTSPNSASTTGARMGHLGSTSLTGAGLRIYASDATTDTFALFFHGTEAALAPSGFGQLCVGGTLVRLDPASMTGPGGVPSHDVDLAALGAAPGDTRFFQCWMRDRQGSVAGYNFSDGLRVTFCP